MAEWRRAEDDVRIAYAKFLDRLAGVGAERMGIDGNPLGARRGARGIKDQFGIVGGWLRLRGRRLDAIQIVEGHGPIDGSAVGEDEFQVRQLVAQLGVGCGQRIIFKFGKADHRAGAGMGQ